jgi:hypothetical protein
VSDLPTQALFVVHVDDNFHPKDPSERYRLGDYPSADAAIAACRQLVDEFLGAWFKPGMRSTVLYETYVHFGEDPFIMPLGPEKASFSAWDYARERCRIMCGH